MARKDQILELIRTCMERDAALKQAQEQYFAAKDALFQVVREHYSDLLDLDGDGPDRPTLLVMDEGSRAFEVCLTGTVHGVEIKSRSICA